MEILIDIITGTDRVRLPNGAIINRYSHVVAGAEIGDNVMVGSFCYIAKSVIIGENSRIQNHNSLWDGVILGNNVFIGPACNFTNEHDPRNRLNRIGEFIPDHTIVGNNATICTNATIICPCNIGEDSFIAASSTVLRDVEPAEKVFNLLK